jgi:hypothetical protein
MLYLNLIDCKSCVYLPPIGQLPNLKYLKIHGATAVSKIGLEFVGSRVGNVRSTKAVAFPRLETLVISNFPIGRIGPLLLKKNKKQLQLVWEERTRLLQIKSRMPHLQGYNYCHD